MISSLTLISIVNKVIGNIIRLFTMIQLGNKIETMSPALIQYELKRLKGKQTDLAKLFGVSTAAISRAINGDSALADLRGRIIKQIEDMKVPVYPQTKR